MTETNVPETNETITNAFFPVVSAVSERQVQPDGSKKTVFSRWLEWNAPLLPCSGLKPVEWQTIRVTGHDESDIREFQFPIYGEERIDYTYQALFDKVESLLKGRSRTDGFVAPTSWEELLADQARGSEYMTHKKNLGLLAEQYLLSIGKSPKAVKAARHWLDPSNLALADADRMARVSGLLAAIGDYWEALPEEQRLPYSLVLTKLVGILEQGPDENDSELDEF